MLVVVSALIVCGLAALAYKANNGLWLTPETFDPYARSSILKGHKPMKYVIALLLCLPLFAITKKAEPTWKTGMLIDQSSERQCSASGQVANGNGSIDETCVIYSFYKIDAGDMIYTVRRGIKFRWDKDLDVTVNAPIRFSIDGRKGYIMDEQGKQHEVLVVQKSKK